MDYKKAYEKALERARKLQETCDSNAVVGWMEYIFPELKESEDEQHRKWILEYLYDGLRKSDEQFKDQFNSAIAWLEKQGEQNPSWSEEDEKFYISALWHIKNSCGNGGNDSGEYEVYNWLKSLKPNHWKPSEEQLRAIINSAQGLYQCKEKEVLLDLYEQLKNL